MLTCNHWHVHIIVILANVSVVIRLSRRQLAVAKTFEEVIVLDICHYVCCDTQAVVVIIWIQNSCLISRVSNLVVHLLPLLGANEVALVAGSLTNLLLSINHFSVRAKTLLEIPV